MKVMLGFYIGGMGAKGQNFHTKLMARMGYEEEALKIQELFFEGRRDEAIAMVPDEFADEISLSARRRASGSGSRRGRTAPCRRCSSTPPASKACARSPSSSSAEPNLV